MDVVESLTFPSNIPRDVEAGGQAMQAQRFRALRAPQLIPIDPTSRLPVPNLAATPLSDLDYKFAADAMKVEANAIAAVAEVETQADGFGRDGRPTIRYELHVFRRLTKGKIR